MLLSLADRADDSGACYPSTSRIEKDTGLDRKTIYSAIASLSDIGAIKVEKSLGVSNRYTLNVTSAEIGTSTEIGTSPKSGTTQSQKRHYHQSQKRHSNLSIESTNNPPEQKQPLADARFDEFWSAYPKKVGKTESLAAWKKAKINGEFPEILKAIEAQKAAYIAENGPQTGVKKWKFLPDPVRWIKNRRWEDEIEVPRIKNQFEGML